MFNITIKFHAESPVMIKPGQCVSCAYHYAVMSPLSENEASTGCALTGESIPDEWDTEKTPWYKCPVIKCKVRRSRGKKHGIV